MMHREAFIHLVKQDTKWNLSMNKSKVWGLLYVLIGVGIGFVFFTLAVRSDQFQLRYMWFFTFALPFVMLGTVYAAFAKEWKNRMYGWWLSLPYSRSNLISAKLIAAFLQTFIVIILAFALIVIFSLYAVAIGETITFSDVMEQLIHGGLWLLMILAYYPIVSVLSSLAFFAARTKYKPVTPLIWVLMVVIINAINWIVQSKNFDEVQQSSLFIVELSSYVWIAIIASWLIAFGLFRLVVRWLEKEVTV